MKTNFAILLLGLIIISCAKPKEEILLEYSWDGSEMLMYPRITPPDSSFMVGEDTI
tara:strand:- start:11193 stop:11360 length:168 start_codon:yes stop_codon:yes gene_type:complete